MTKQRCYPHCPQLRSPPSMMSLCLLCWNTGYRIPLGPKAPTIDQWLRMHASDDTQGAP